MMTTAFDPIELGGKRLANRIVMAPMTRSRAYGRGATELMATYYAQRSSAGLIITEGVQPSVIGQGYPDTPGLHSAEQVTAWRQVTDAVHREGGVIFAQLLHTGRIGHPGLLPAGLVPVAPSAIAAKGRIYTHQGLQDFVTPQELDDEEIVQTIADFADAARNAIAAGFDGVELHGANGYLIHQFLAPNTNQRTDRWGGDTSSRARFAVDVTRAVADAIGAHRTGVRFSPGSPSNDIDETDQANLAATYTTVAAALAPMGLAYLHILEGPDQSLTGVLRKDWPGTFILNPFTSPEPTDHRSLSLIEDGAADMLAFGALFVANPDLPARLAVGGPYNTPDAATFYGGDHRGYTDYPALPADSARPE